MSRVQSIRYSTKRVWDVVHARPDGRCEVYARGTKKDATALGEQLVAQHGGSFEVKKREVETCSVRFK